MASSSRLPVATLHATVLIWAATALFAKLIPLPAEQIIYLRSLPAWLALVLFMLIGGRLHIGSPRQLGVGLLLGLTMAGHWVSFYLAVQLSTVAIGLITLYTYPLLTALFEPLLQRRRPALKPLLLALLGLIGVILIASSALQQEIPLMAVLAGLVSAGLFMVRNLISKYLAADVPSIQQMFYQVTVTLVLLAVLLGFEPIQHASPQDWGLLILLGTVFVALPHTLYLYCLKRIDVTRASLMSMVQPVYGILMALLFLHEVPSWAELSGGLLVLLTATYATRENSK